MTERVFPLQVGVARKPTTYKTAYLRRFFCALFILLSILTPVVSQEVEAETVGEKLTRAELISESLLLDLATSGPEELKAWCLILGLDGSGTEEDLRARLKTYYGIVASSPSTVESQSAGTKVVIESAKRSEYLVMDIDSKNDEESIVRLTGDVVLTVDESDRGRTHHVRADTVIFNQALKTISALGNIVYTVDTNGREEKFTGDSLVFTVTDWTGVIFKGTSERNQEVDGEQINFFFRGESIKRSGAEILVLENGTITSHNVDNPDFALKARKIWITGPGEWGLFSATLYIGHIPIFYLPFYWKAGSDLFLNPVIGQRSSAGYYIQTTTYFIGRKEEDDDFSMLGFGDSAGPEYALEREGLFMVRSGATGEGASVSDNTLKLMIDAYTSLGFMTGLYGDFPNLGDKGSLDFYASMGMSRSIDNDGNVYFKDSSGDAKVYWNSGYIGSFEMPFRWGLDVDYSWDSWSLELEWYSDPSYLKQFDQREENFDWLSFLMSEEESDVDEPDLVSSMSWDFEGSHSFSVPTDSTWIGSFSLDSFKTSLSWKSKERDSTSDFWNKADADYNPAADFFYPHKLIFPEIDFSFDGGSPQWTVEREKDNHETEDESETEESDTYFEMPFHDSFESVYKTNILEASIDYGIDTQMYMESEFDDDDWDDPEDIDFEMEATKINTTQSGYLSYDMALWDGLTDISGTTSLSGYYQTHAHIFGDGPNVEEDTRTEDMQYTKLLWDNSFSLSIYPLQGVHSLSGSYVKYNIDTNLYSREFGSDATVSDPFYVNKWISDEDDFRKHAFAASFQWVPGSFSLSSSASVNIPPMDESFTLSAGADYDYKGWDVGIDQNVTFSDSEWTVSPTALSVSWTGFDGEMSAEQTLRFDSENNRISKMNSELELWGFETSFTAEYDDTYTWDGAPNYSWDESGEAFVPSYLSFSYSREIDPKPMWKNRIKLDTVLNISWDIDLIQPTDNALTFTWTQNVEIFKFLDLNISFAAANKSMYLYFPWWRNRFGITQEYNFFGDLFKSFNFFNTQDRRDSQFNMSSVSVDLVHHLRNWDLTLEYDGKPVLESGASNYEWESEFSIYLKWNPLPMFNQKTTYEDATLSVDSFE